MKTPWPLPADWEWRSFADVAHVASDLVDPAGYSNSPHIAPNHIESGTGRLLSFRTVGEDEVTSAKHRFRSGQLLYSKIRPYLAKVAIPEVDGLCSADMYPIDTQLETRYLKWWMLTREFTRLAAGEQARTVLPKINKRALAQLPVPVAPTLEQRQIVDIVEDHLSRLDAAREQLRLSACRAKFLVTASLAHHVGRATANCPLTTVGAEAERVEYGSGAKAGVAAGACIPVLRMGNLKQGRIDWTSLKYLPANHPDLSRLMLVHGDLLFNRTNSAEHVGKAAVFDTDQPTTFASYLIRVRFSEWVNPHWAKMAINSPQGREHVATVVSQQVGQANVNGTKLKAFPLPLPSRAEQDRRVAEHMSVEDSAQRLQTAIAVADASGADLKLLDGWPS